MIAVNSIIPKIYVHCPYVSTFIDIGHPKYKLHVKKYSNNYDANGMAATVQKVGLQYATGKKCWTIID